MEIPEEKKRQNKTTKNIILLKAETNKRSDTLSESEKKLAEQEAILSINANGQAEFFELTKIKVPYTTDNKGLTNTDWMAGCQTRNCSHSWH